MASSEEPLSWTDGRLGARVRVALWLRDEVGEGNTFTKQRLRRNIAGVEQVDRRMRDLRPAGWVIRTYKDRPGLRPDELFLERIGLPIWEPEFRSTGIRRTQDEVRRAVFDRDSHVCTLCGAIGGQTYADDANRVVQLSAVSAGSEAASPDVLGADALVTVCTRCSGSELVAADPFLSVTNLWEKILALSTTDRRQLLQWMERDKIKDLTLVELTWSLYRRLPPTARGVLRRRLGSLGD